MHDRRSLSLAATSSVTVVKTWSDHPSSTVCPLSTTRERPLRSSASRASRPELSTPTRPATMKMPPMVTRNIRVRKSPLNSSPATAPGSSARIRLIHSVRATPSSRTSSSATVSDTTPTTTTSAAEAAASNPMRAGVPRDIALSNL